MDNKNFHLNYELVYQLSLVSISVIDLISWQPGKEEERFKLVSRKLVMPILKPEVFQ